MAGECPKCGSAVQSVTINHIDVKEKSKNRWHGVSYSCPHCNAILSVGIDPIALKSDTIAELVKALKKP